MVDLDWEHIRAVDIYAALRSFLPAGGRIESVTVYPSDYGLQRMKEEATRGPQVLASCFVIVEARCARDVCPHILQACGGASARNSS